MNLKRERPLAMFCTSRVPPRSFLHTLSRLHKSRRVSNRCSFFAGAAGRFGIPRAQQ